MALTILKVTTTADENDGSSGRGLSLRDAITLANQNPRRQYEIQLQSGQTYKLTLDGNREHFNKTGDLELALDFQFAKPDPLLFQLGLGLKQLLESGAQGSRLYAETLTHTIMVHLLQHYTNKPTQLKTYRNGLSSAKLKRVTDYIQANLDQDLSLKELARLL